MRRWKKTFANMSAVLSQVALVTTVALMSMYEATMAPCHNATLILSDVPCPNGCVCSVWSDGNHMKCTKLPPLLNSSMLTTTVDLHLVNIEETSTAYSHVLNKLFNLRRLQIVNSNFTRLGNIFANLSHLEELKFIKNNKITDIAKNCFESLRSLRRVMFKSLQYLTLAKLQAALMSIRSRLIDTIIIDYVGPNSLKYLSEDFFFPFRHCPVGKLILTNLGLVKLNPGFNRYIPEVTCLILTGNEVPRTSREEAIRPLLAMKKLRVLDLSHVTLVNSVGIPEFCSFCHEPFSFMEEINDLNGSLIATTIQHYNTCSTIDPYPINLRYLTVTSYRDIEQTTKPPGPICFNYTNRIRYLNFLNNNYKFDFAMYGLLRLQVLDVRNSGITSLNNGAFCNSPSIKLLFMGGNNLKGWFDTRNATYPLSKLKHLIYLDLSHNDIRTLSSSDFQTITKIRFLDLSSNLITTRDINYKCDFRFNYLNLSYNNLFFLPENFLESFDKAIQNRKQKSVSQNFLHVEVLPKIDLSGNPLQCSCESLPFLQWYRNNTKHFYNYENYTCEKDSAIIEDINNLNLPILAKLCVIKAKGNGTFIPTTVVTATTAVVTATTASGSIIILVLLSLVVYRYRHNVKYFAYFWPYMKIRMLCFRRMSQPYNILLELGIPYIHDVFILCSNDDMQFVQRSIKPQLINKGFSVSLGAEDFIAGQPITSEIHKAMSSCNCVLIILSNNFLKSPWLNYEVTMAIVMKIKVIIVNIDDPTYRMMPPAVIYLYRQYKTRQRYPTNEPQLLPKFWSKLSTGITKMKTAKF